VSKRGLPTNIQMRHDAHYVEELSAQSPTPVGRLISTELLDPNPEQPRVEIGDLSELIESVRDKGILEPLLVKPNTGNGRWMIIAGERRWRAARACGLKEVPCIEMDVDDRAIAEIALIENLQRKDLTPWEEADGLAALCEKFGYTHEDVARKIGKSRSTITETLSIVNIPKAIREQCRQADINSKSLLLQIVRQPDEATMQSFVDEIIGRNLNREEARSLRRESNLPKKSQQAPYVFRFNSPDEDFKLEIKFKRAQVQSDEIIQALKTILAEMEQA
jgi:ParB family chromosome partitioning protein